MSNETHTQFNASYLIRTDWEKVWERAIKKGASPSNGWLLTSALAHLKDEGIIGGYIKIGQVGEAVIPKIKAMICENKAVYTGVPVANWKETLRTHYFTLTKATLAGHAFDITGYDDDYQCQDGTQGAFLVGNSQKRIISSLNTLCCLMRTTHDYKNSNHAEKTFTCKKRSKKRFGTKNDLPIWQPPSKSV